MTNTHPSIGSPRSQPLTTPRAQTQSPAVKVSSPGSLSPSAIFSCVRLSADRMDFAGSRSPRILPHIHVSTVPRARHFQEAQLPKATMKFPTDSDGVTFPSVFTKRNTFTLRGALFPICLSLVIISVFLQLLCAWLLLLVASSVLPEHAEDLLRFSSFSLQCAYYVVLCFRFALMCLFFGLGALLGWVLGWVFHFVGLFVCTGRRRGGISCCTDDRGDSDGQQRRQ